MKKRTGYSPVRLSAFMILHLVSYDRVFVIIPVIRAFRMGIYAYPVGIVFVHRDHAVIGVVVLVIYVIYAGVTGTHSFLRILSRAGNDPGPVVPR